MEQIEQQKEAVNLKGLASMRSLIINPSTPDSILETLTHSLEPGADPLLHHHTLKLLSDLSTQHSKYSSKILNSLSSYVLRAESARHAAEALDAMWICGSRDGVWVDDHFVVSLCFAPCVPLRLWLFRNLPNFGVRPHLLFPLMFGFTKDPFPCLRTAALDALVGLSDSEVAHDKGVVEGCYCTAVQLLTDIDDSVRSAAVRAISKWGLLLIASSEETNRKDLSDAVFLQLCSMVRDMSLEVRVGAFEALGSLTFVSENLLLQSLSKKVLAISKDKEHLSQYFPEPFQTLLSTAAGAFVHGIEDDFCEVRKSACNCLSTLTALSLDFAAEALNYLMGILNNDSVVDRLQVLETMLHMSSCGHLNLQETHMHVFLCTLVDINALVRAAARNILKWVKLPNMKVFKSCFNGLLENLERNPQDEADIYSVLFRIGQNHGTYAVGIIKEIEKEIEPASEGKLNFDNARTAAVLVLAISVPSSPEKLIGSIVPTVFSYAVTLLGRISFALRDIMSQDELLSYMSQCSRSAGASATEFEEKHVITPHGFKNGSNMLMENQLNIHNEIRRCMDLILEQVKNSSPMIKSGCIHRVLKTLRFCKEQLLTLATASQEFSGHIAFTLHYLHVAKLLAKLWPNFVPRIKIHTYDMGELDFLLGKLDRILREMRCIYIGLSKKVELHILELMLLASTMRLCKFEYCRHHTTIKKLRNTVSRIEYLNKDEMHKASNFLTELTKLLCQIEANENRDIYDPFIFENVIALFSFEHLELRGEIEEISAELDVPDNNSENPLLYVSGLPVSIPMMITLHNIPIQSKLWVRMTLGEDTTQFLFLDFGLYDCDGTGKFTFNAPFYRTPKASYFTLRVSIGLESMSEDVHIIQPFGGPKHELVYVCEEKYISLSSKLY